MGPRLMATHWLLIYERNVSCGDFTKVYTNFAKISVVSGKKIKQRIA